MPWPHLEGLLNEINTFPYGGWSGNVNSSEPWYDQYYVFWVGLIFQDLKNGQAMVPRIIAERLGRKVLSDRNLWRVLGGMLEEDCLAI